MRQQQETSAAFLQEYGSSVAIGMTWNQDLLLAMENSLDVIVLQDQSLIPDEVVGFYCQGTATSAVILTPVNPSGCCSQFVS
jgi:hypothetical protein